MTNISINKFTFLKLLEASQTSFESSEKALKAAEEALTAAKIANVEAKAALNAATEAFQTQSFCNTSEKNEKSTSDMSFVDQEFKTMTPDPDSDLDEPEEDFMFLSSNKNPVTDLEDDRLHPGA